MSMTSPSPSRRDERIAAIMQVTFSINEGPPQTSDTLNLSHKSLAIRSDCTVAKGDHISAQIDDLPKVTGRVIRVFDEGFAVQLAGHHYALVARAKDGDDTLVCEGEQVTSGANEVRITSAFFQLTSKQNARARFTTVRGESHACDRHYFTIIVTGSLDIGDIRNVWISIDETRSAARIVRTGRRADQTMLALALNDGQLRMAARYGVTVSIIVKAMQEWTASAPLAAINDHLQMLTGEAVALTA